VCVFAVRYSVYIFYLQYYTLLLCAPPHRRPVAVGYAFMRSGKRDQTILFVYDIMHIILCLYNGTNFYGNYTLVRINSTAL